MPKWLRKDPITKRFVLYLSVFDCDSIINELRLDKTNINSLSWTDFSYKTTHLVKAILAELGMYYKEALSARLCHSICEIFAGKLNAMESKYRKFRKASAKGELKLSKTVMRLERYKVIVYFYKMIHRENVF